jgi:transposase
MRPISQTTTQKLSHCRPDDATLYASLELSRATWLVTALSPGSEKMSKYSTLGGDGAALLGLLRRLQARAERLAGGPVDIVVIQEAGLDGFWVHRLLNAHGIQSHVVDPASIAVPRRRRRAKTDAIDGETLLRTLLAWQRGEPRVCAMVVPPTPEQEDRRRTSRERAVLLQERVRHVNRIKGLLASQGITDYEPLHKDRRARLAALHTGDGQPLPLRLKAELLREIELVELLIRQIAEVEVERDIAAELDVEGNQSPVALLARLKAIGPQIAAVLYLEGLYRSFANRREVAAYAGLVPTPWRSGTDRSRAGDLQGRQPAPAPHHDRVGLVVGEASARQCAEPLVPRTGWHRAGADPADRHCRARTQVADRALALREARGSAGGGGV